MGVLNCAGRFLFSPCSFTLLPPFYFPRIHDPFRPPSAHTLQRCAVPLFPLSFFPFPRFVCPPRKTCCPLSAKPWYGAEVRQVRTPPPPPRWLHPFLGIYLRPSTHTSPSTGCLLLFPNFSSLSALTSNLPFQVGSGIASFFIFFTPPSPSRMPALRLGSRRVIDGHGEKFPTATEIGIPFLSP